MAEDAEGATFAREVEEQSAYLPRKQTQVDEGVELPQGPGADGSQLGQAAG